MNYKEEIYKSYLSNHNSLLYGKPTLEKFNRQHRLNNYYLGEFLPEDNNSKILDLGCGDGNLVYWFQQKGYLNSYGIDISEEQINAGRALGIENLILKDIHLFLNTTQDTFDFIIGRDIFEHFSKQEIYDLLKAINKVLKIGGTLILQVPNGEGIHVNGILYGDITHEIPFTKSSLRQLILSAGFSKIETYPINPFPGTLFGFFRNVLWKYKVMWLKFWQLVERGHSNSLYTSNLIACIIK
jgi:2-polyprenyl-3-methyl-5-hydroxy-6-metoxy-1,4-benzoquinol methylase